MTAKVYEFSPRAATNNKAAVKKCPVDSRSTQEIFVDTYNDIIYDWDSHARKNRLSEFIHDRLSAFIYSTPDVDLAHDINAISQIEQRLEMKIGIFAPGTTSNNPFGWLVAFYTGPDIFTTPPDLASEAHARAMNILLYVTFMYHLKTLGRL